LEHNFSSFDVAKKPEVRASTLFETFLHGFVFSSPWFCCTTCNNKKGRVQTFFFVCFEDLLFSSSKSKNSLKKEQKFIVEDKMNDFRVVADLFGFYILYYRFSIPCVLLQRNNWKTLNLQRSNYKILIL
jgi:hypothetical protein